MNIKTLVLLGLFSFTLKGQNTVFRVKNNYWSWEVSSKFESEEDPNKKFKIKFSKVNNGKYYVFNRLLYGNKSAKVLTYFKEFDVYVIREQYALKYLTFNEAFPKGGFYKDGNVKTIFGQKSERYSLDNDVLDFKIWIANGVQEPDNFVSFLNEVGILKNIPMNKKIIALSLQGLELDLSEIEMANEGKGGIASYLEDVLVSFIDKEKLVKKCLDSLPEKKDFATKDFDQNTPKTFQYKITQNGTYEDGFYKKTKNFNAVIYSSSDGKSILHVTPESDEINYNATLIDYDLKKMTYCKLKDEKLTIISSEELINTKECDLSALKFISKSENGNFYFSSKQSQFYLIKYEIDEKNFPLLTNWNLKNGFIKSYIAFDKDLNKQTVNRSLEAGTYTFNFIKE